MEGLRVSLNNQTERVKHLQDQVKNLDQGKEEAIRKLAELEAKQKEMKPKLTADVGCGSDEVIKDRKASLSARREGIIVSQLKTVLNEKFRAYC